MPNAVHNAVNAIHSDTFLADNGNFTEITPVMKIPNPITNIPNVPDMKLACDDFMRN
jgi:hypothetical protein